MAPGPKEEVYYFIDDNRAYRGPVSEETLHLLFATEAITRSTYVFADHLSADHSWIRLKRLPDLLDQLMQPLPSFWSELESHPGQK